MHALKLLSPVLPEIDAIDSLVLRDLYRRYTVDEHTFLTIESLHQLAVSNEAGGSKPFAELHRARFERPELLYLALLLHDTGKGALDGTDHVRSSLQLTAVADGTARTERRRRRAP